MPRVEDDDPEAEHVEAMLAARADFERGFQRSRRGNLWRLWEGKTLCVFRRSDGWFGWSIADGESVRYSARSYDTEGDALGGLWDATAGAEWRMWD